jgi:hypothetical protein
MINSVNRVYLGLREIEKSVLCKFVAKQRSDWRNKVVLARLHMLVKASATRSANNNNQHI